MTLPKHRTLLLIAAIAVVGLMGYGATALPPKEAYSLKTIERATTPAEHAEGLSGRPSIPEDYGMLFVFEKRDDYAFWMKDMLTPIDIIWLSDTGVILSIDASVATSTFPNAFRPPQPVRYVLETKAGTAAMQGWNPGTQLSLPIAK